MCPQLISGPMPHLSCALSKWTMVIPRSLLSVRSRTRHLDRFVTSEKAEQNAASVRQLISELRPGTTLGREWNGQMQRVSVLSDGFAWNGNTYGSLSQVAFAITGTRWNGPRFFGLRDTSAKGR
jgi:hypothetical protein